MPRPLLSKLAAQAAVGLFCTLFGCLHGIRSDDTILIFLSMCIGLCSLIHGLYLGHIAFGKRYYVLETKCIAQEKVLIGRMRRVSFVGNDGKVYQLMLDKRVKFITERSYRIYFLKSLENTLTPENMNSQEFLCLEQMN